MPIIPFHYFKHSTILTTLKQEFGRIAFFAEGMEQKGMKGITKSNYNY